MPHLCHKMTLLQYKTQKNCQILLVAPKLKKPFSEMLVLIAWCHINDKSSVEIVGTAQLSRNANVLNYESQLR